LARVDQEFIGVAAAGFAVQRVAPLAEDLFQFFLGVRSELLDGFDAQSAEGTLGDFTNAGNFADGERREKERFHSGRDPDEAARLGLFGSHFGDKTCGGKAAGTGKRGGFRDGAEEFVRGGERRAVKALGAREIEMGLVNGNHFHDGRELAEDGGDAIAPFAVFFVVPVEKDRVGAETRGGAQRHRGMDAELASFVAGSGDDAALIGPAADDHGSAAKVRALQEFHGDEEGVHVHVEDGRMQGSISHFGGIVFSAKASEVRHAVSVRLWFRASNVNAANTRVSPS